MLSLTGLLQVLLLRQIYGLRRAFPTDLTYAPEDVGERDEFRLSDIAQLQKWQYLHSIAQLNPATAEVVTSLIRRASIAAVTHSSFYCSSLLKWGCQMGLIFSSAPSTPLSAVMA
jgi:hypothetical protein